jgi:hypothetical protein
MNHLPNDSVDLLVQTLRFAQNPKNIAELRQNFLSPQTDLDALFVAAKRRQLTTVMIENLSAKGIVHPAPSGSTASSSLRGQFRHFADSHAARRAALTKQLADLAGILNTAGITPLMLKGAATLVTGEPSWREQRDIDFAIRPDQVALTKAVLKQNGFVQWIEIDTNHHHLSPLKRPDDPVFVEPHARINGSRSEHLLPDKMLWDASVEVDFASHRVRLLRPDHFLLQGLTHHHFQNRGGVLGVINIKGLLEFSDAIRRLEGGEVARLRDFLGGSHQLAEAVELWCAAGQLLLGAHIPEDLLPSQAAYRRAEAIWAGTPRTPGFVFNSNYLHFTGSSSDAALTKGFERLRSQIKTSEQRFRLIFYTIWPFKKARQMLLKLLFRSRDRQLSAGIMLFDEERRMPPPIQVDPRTLP